MTTANQSGQQLAASAGPSSTAQFGAGVSQLNAAEQFLPPFFNDATALTRWPGVLVAGDAPPVGTAGTGEQRVIQTVRIRYTGDVANVGGQTVSVKVYKTPRGSAVPAQVGQTLSGIPTTAGLQEGALTFTSPVQCEPGDELTASITPSGALTVPLTNISVAVN